VVRRVRFSMTLTVAPSTTHQIACTWQVEFRQTTAESKGCVPITSITTKKQANSIPPPPLPFVPPRVEELERSWRGGSAWVDGQWGCGGLCESIGATGLKGIGRLLHLLFLMVLLPLLLQVCSARCDGASESKVRGGEA